MLSDEMPRPGAESRRWQLALAPRTLDGGHGRSCEERCHSRRCAPASDVGIRLDDGRGSVVHAPVRNGGQLVTRRGISLKVVVQFAIGNALVV